VAAKRTGRGPTPPNSESEPLMNLDSPAILNALPDAVLVRDGDGVVRFVNPAAERLLGVRAADLVGGRELPWLSAEDLAAGQPKIAVDADGLRLEVEVVSLDGAEAGSLVLYRVVMLSKQLQEYYWMSIDLLSRITPCRGGLDLVTRGYVGEVNAQQSEILSILSRNVNLLRDGLLTLQQILALDGNFAVYQKEPCNINSIVLIIFTGILDEYKKSGWTIRHYWNSSAIAFKKISIGVISMDVER